MRGLATLTRKELKGQLRTYKLFIVAGVFAMLGMITPLSVYYTPYLLEGMEGVEDMAFELPVLTGPDVVIQYATSLTQLGILALILIGMGAIASERRSGTAAMVLCKPVGRGSFIIAKLLALSATSLASLALGGIVCYAYTSFLFGEVDASAFLVLHLLLGLYIVTCLSVVLLCSSFFKSQLAAGGIALATIIVLAMMSGIPRIGVYVPLRLVDWGTRLVAGPAPSAWWAVVVSLGIIIVCLSLLVCVAAQGAIEVIWRYQGE